MRCRPQSARQVSVKPTDKIHFREAASEAMRIIGTGVVKKFPSCEI